MRAKEYLFRVKKLNALIQNKLFEKEQLLALATSATQRLTEARVQTSPNQNRMTDVVDKIIELEAETDALIDRFVDMKNEIIHTIEQLDADDYDLLHKVYIQQMSLKDAADRLYKSYGSITTAHGRALQKVQRLLDAREKSGET